MTTYNRPQTTNLLRTKGIPLELVDIINSYVFNSYETIHKKIMSEIVEEIKYGCYFALRENLLTRQWGFRSYSGPQFQCSFCIQCGDYSTLYTDSNYEECVLCVCMYSEVNQDRIARQHFEDEEHYYV